MPSKEEIRQAVLAIVEGKIPLNSSWCKVKSVNVGKKTCDVIFDDDEDLVIPGILLGFDKSGVVVIPKVNTDVLVMFISNTRMHGAVVAVEETTAIELMGVEYGGIPKARVLQDKINTLEDHTNKIKLAVAALAAAASGPGASTPLTAASLLAFFSAAGFDYILPIVPTTSAEIENTKVKHGKGVSNPT